MDRKRAIDKAMKEGKGTRVPMGTSGAATEPTKVDTKTEAKPKAEPKPKAKKVRRPKGVDFSTLSPKDFFREDGKNFRMGHDARLTGILKRIAAGTASDAERKLGLDPAFLDHPKVKTSTHFQPLVRAAQTAK